LKSQTDIWAFYHTRLEGSPNPSANSAHTQHGECRNIGSNTKNKERERVPALWLAEEASTAQMSHNIAVIIIIIRQGAEI
jgi:hypothetical protein